MPYVLMHFRGNPPIMDLSASYEDVVLEVYEFLTERIGKILKAGVRDIIIDPGFGFGKQPPYNYELLAGLKVFAELGFPLLVGLSRKSMFWRPMGLTPRDVLPATCAANLIALMQGAVILRVHDVDACKQVINVYSMWREGLSKLKARWNIEDG